MRVAGKAGRGRGAGVSRRGPAPSLTILPNQSGEIRLTANLLDTRRRFAPPTKKAGNGRNGGYRGKGWQEAERVRRSGEIRLAANLWIRGDASRRQRKGRGAEGWAGIERRMAGGGTGTVQAGKVLAGAAGLWYTKFSTTKSPQTTGNGGKAMEFRRIFDTIPDQFDRWRPRYCAQSLRRLRRKRIWGPGRRPWRSGRARDRRPSPSCARGAIISAWSWGSI